MTKLLALLAVMAAALALLVLSDRPQPKADFTFINRGDVNTLDLQRMSWMQDLRVARCLFEGLVKNDVFTHEFKIVPGMAERWDISDDGLTYTFHLRDDAMWSNGEPVVASDFVYSWRRALLPDTVSDYVGMFFLIEGGQAFYDWRLEATMPENFKASGKTADELWAETERRFDEMVALDALDDRTLRVRLVRRVPYFLDLVAFAVFSPVYPPLVSQYERPEPDSGKLDVQSGWTKPPLLVSNGPFVLEMWRFKRDMRMRKSELYWDRDSINVDTIAMPSVEDPNAQVLAFDSGAVQWLSDVTPTYRGDMLLEKERFYAEHAEEVARLRAMGLDPIEVDRRLPDDPRKNIHALPAFGTYFYNFNCQPKLQDGRDNPFADARVRRAFAMAIDKARVARDVRRLGEPVATTLIPPGSIGGYNSPKGLPFDPERARAELAAAGYPGGKGFVTVELLFNRDGAHGDIAQAVKKDWEENLGVEVMLQQKEIKVFRNDLKNHNFMTSRAGWFGDYGDPTTFLELNKTGDGNNDRSFSSAAYDQLLDEANAESDPEKRMRILERAEAMIVDVEVPMIPIFHYAQIYLFDPDEVTGISSHPRQQQDIYRVDVFGDGKGADKPVVLPARAPSGDGSGGRGMPSRSVSSSSRDAGASDEGESGGEQR